MEHGTLLLHIHLHSVDDDEWLGIGIEGIETTDEHGRAAINGAGTLNGTDICAEHSLDVFVDNGIAATY